MKNLIVLFSVLMFFACNSSNNSSDTGADSLVVEAEEIDLLDTAGGKGVFFVDLVDSQEVTSPVMVKMGVVGMEVEKAGSINDLKGHHHLYIDASPTPYGETVVADELHIHFGQGQTESEQTLTPGYHTLTLQFANGVHASYGPRWSKSIVVLVK